MIIQADAQNLPLKDESIDMVMTSPPYWGLRDYGLGKSQLGLEPTPEMFIEHLTQIFNEVKRVLKKEGTLWLNMGDTYGGSNTGHTGPAQTKWQSVPRGNGKSLQSKLQPKCLLMIPERLAWSLIQNGWILRNKIVWHKPNAMPSSVKDRFSNKWEYLFMFSKSKQYYFDLDAVREAHAESGIERMKYPVSDWKGSSGKSSWVQTKDNPKRKLLEYNPKGKNPGDVIEIEDGILKGKLAYKINQFEEAHPEIDLGWFSDLIGDIIQAKLKPSDFWNINTQPFPEAHFAVFPKKLCEKPIKAGCPEGGIVLDPFCGAGTVGVVARDMKRQFIGIDIKQEYCKMAEKRLAQGVL